MSNPDFFFSRPSNSRLLFFEYSTDYPDFQSDLHEFYRPGTQASLLPFELAKMAYENKSDAVVLSYDHPSRNPDLVAKVYIETTTCEDIKKAMLEFAQVVGYKVTEEDIPDLVDHGDAYVQAIGIIPGREAPAFHMVYRGKPEHFANLAEVGEDYKNFTFQYTLSKEGTKNYVVEIHDEFETFGPPELDGHVAHCKDKLKEAFGDRVQEHNICSYKFYLESGKRKMYYRVLLKPQT